ncbi:ATP-binding protein, partial [Ammoniphilus sp. 3BR4]|uniref:ATP-binding protein n=1 Tax=Ammoniphilus sp. 3BR4 TaxID=3158265 RepID=UPI0034651049
YSIVYYSWILLIDNQYLKYTGGSILSTIAPIMAGIFFYLNIKRLKGKERDFWIILFISCFSCFIAELLWRFHIVFTGTDYFFPGWADLFWIINLLFYAFALLYKVHERRKQYRVIQMFFDSFMILTVLTSISWVYFLEPILHRKELPLLLSLISLAYPIAHLGVLLGVIMLFLSYRNIIPPKMLFLHLSGMIIYVISDTIYLYKSIYEQYEFYTVLTPVWSVALLLIGLSSFYDTESKTEEIEITGSNLLSYLRMFLPYCSILILLILAILNMNYIESIIVGGIVVLILIVIRQILTLLENESLLRQLRLMNHTLEKTKCKLTKSEQRYRSLFENHPNAVYLFDSTGKSKAINKAAKSFINGTIHDQTQLLVHFQKAMGGESQHFERSILHQEGYTVPCNITFVPVIIDGKTNGLFGIYQDLSEKKRTEELLRKSEKLAVASQLAAGVAHEIRNPLTSIKGFLQLIEEGLFKPSYMDILKSELNRIESILNEFLTIAKPHQESLFVRSNICNILENVIQLMNTNAIMRNIQIVADIDPDIPEIECIENQLIQVFINIIKNAVEASENNGRIIIRVKKEGNQQIVISFQDHGCGISEDRIHKLGEPFYSNKEKGTGLGLMITYKIIEHHKGTIQVSSKVNKGTTITITLPLSQE